jgi:hypothetical protein
MALAYTRQMGTWMIYFDNHPHGHFGTIRQQIWSALHFPIHLAIVGLVEGAQQIALARYVFKGIHNFEMSLVQYCFKDHLDGKALSGKLSAAVKYLSLDKKVASLIFLDEIESDIYFIGNQTGICGPRVTGSGVFDLPDVFIDLYANTVAAMYSALGLSMPVDKNVISVMVESWKLVYRYFWSAFLILIGCFLVVMILIRTTKVDAFDYMAFFDRGAVVVVAAALLGLSASKDLIYHIMETPYILPVAVILLYLIIILDRIGAWIANRRNRKSGDPLTGGEHGHGHGHGDAEGHGGGHEDAADKQGLMVSAAQAPPHPVDHRASFNPLGGSMMPTYYAAGTPPTYPQPHMQPMTPPAGGVGVSTAYTPGGYMPVQNGHYAGDGY